MRRRTRVPDRGLPSGLSQAHGFTLIELMVVVLIITVFASLAVPSVVNQLRDRRVQEAARKIASLYRQARLHALGRGTAVLVSYSGTTDSFTVQEARQGAGACPALPNPSCTGTTWATTDATQRQIGGYQEAATGDMSGVQIGMQDSVNTALTTLQICFTPMGHSFARTAANAAFTPLSQTYRATVSRPGLGRARNVLLLPNGTARLMTQ